MGIGNRRGVRRDQTHTPIVFPQACRGGGKIIYPSDKHCQQDTCFAFSIASPEHLSRIETFSTKRMSSLFYSQNNNECTNTPFHKSKEYHTFCSSLRTSIVVLLCTAFCCQMGRCLTGAELEYPCCDAPNSTINYNRAATMSIQPFQGVFKMTAVVHDS